MWVRHMTATKGTTRTSCIRVVHSNVSEIEWHFELEKLMRRDRQACMARRHLFVRLEVNNLCIDMIEVCRQESTRGIRLQVQFSGEREVGRAAREDSLRRSGAVEQRAACVEIDSRDPWNSEHQDNCNTGPSMSVETSLTKEQMNTDMEPRTNNPIAICLRVPYLPQHPR